MYSVQTLATEHGLSLAVTCSCLLVPLCHNQKVATETTKLRKFYEKKNHFAQYLSSHFHSL